MLKVKDLLLHTEHMRPHELQLSRYVVSITFPTEKIYIYIISLVLKLKCFVPILHIKTVFVNRILFEISTYSQSWG